MRRALLLSLLLPALALAQGVKPSGIKLANIGSSPNAKGATFALGTLTLQPADATYGGVLTAGTQTIAGAKTFALGPTLTTGIVTSGVANGSGAIGFKLVTPAYSTSGAKLASWFNDTTEKVYITKDGAIDTVSAMTASNGFGLTAGLTGASFGMSNVSSGNLALTTSADAKFISFGAPSGLKFGYLDSSASRGAGFATHMLPIQLSAASVAPSFRAGATQGKIELGPGGCTVAIGGLVRAGTTVTATCSAPHAFGNGQTVAIYPGETNYTAGNKTITGVGASTFTYEEAGAETPSTAIQYPSVALDTSIARTAANTITIGAGAVTAGVFGPTGLSLATNDAAKVTFAATDSSGTPGAATINKPSGQSSIANGAAAVTITNSNVTSASICLAVLQEADAGCTGISSVVPGAGSFVITANANCTNATATNVGWVCFN